MMFRSRRPRRHKREVVIDPSLYDLDRVEVLRGPKNVVRVRFDGRTVKLVTNQPNLQALGAALRPCFPEPTAAV